MLEAGAGKIKRLADACDSQASIFAGHGPSEFDPP